jgi:hypothetical protein
MMNDSSLRNIRMGVNILKLPFELFEWYLYFLETSIHNIRIALLKLGMLMRILRIYFHNLRLTPHHSILSGIIWKFCLHRKMLPTVW